MKEIVGSVGSGLVGLCQRLALRVPLLSLGMPFGLSLAWLESRQEEPGDPRTLNRSRISPSLPGEYI